MGSPGRWRCLRTTELYEDRVSGVQVARARCSWCILLPPDTPGGPRATYRPDGVLRAWFDDRQAAARAVEELLENGLIKITNVVAAVAEGA